MCWIRGGILSASFKDFRQRPCQQADMLQIPWNPASLQNGDKVGRTTVDLDFLGLDTHLSKQIKACLFLGMLFRVFFGGEQLSSYSWACGHHLTH